MKYKINEVVPKYMGLRELTPKEMRCIAFHCPSIYEGLRELTPQGMRCIIINCPSTYGAKRKGKEVYLIVGKLVNPAEAGLEKKVGEDEALIEVPRTLIDDRRK